MSQGHWKYISNQRQWLDDIAKNLKITDTDGWYKVTTKVIQQQKGGSGLLSKYNGSLARLLVTVYPEYHDQRTH